MQTGRKIPDPLPLLLTPGEPAGIGPDLAVMLAQKPQPRPLIALADPGLLIQRAQQLDLPLRITERDGPAACQPSQAGELQVWPRHLARPASPGRLEPANAAYVIECIETATRSCLDSQAAAMVTGPVHKAVINQAGHAFTGHTGFIGTLCGEPDPLMLLCNESLRVALATVHIPLSAVPTALTRAGLSRSLNMLNDGLKQRFGLARPRILVAGLNPHAGEDGYLGREEIDVITPTLDHLRERGLNLEGPLPADTLFTAHKLQQADAVLAMYHDQGLPVIKHRGFGRTVNVTLGLPIIRCSVDHGTALSLAGTGRADCGSLHAAVTLADEMSLRAVAA